VAANYPITQLPDYSIRKTGLSMEIADWRKQIDELDRKLVELLNQRAAAAKAIGNLKRQTELPIYEPTREQEIFQNIRRANQGPLPDRDLVQLYERIIDVMRKLQHEQITGGAEPAHATGGTEIEADADE
jgi:chorismate mutase